jgi:hypothetical protein
MIQRKQTIWLLLAAICGFVYTQVPIFVATLGGNAVKKYLPTESLLLFAVSIAIAALGVVAIFLFKNRPTQAKLSLFGILGSIAIIALQVWQLEQFKASDPLLKGTYAWGSLLPIAMTVFYILALGGIRKDEKLVKSLDRLR